MSNEIENVLPLIDRMIKPLAEAVAQLGAQQREDTQRINTKLDEVIKVGERVSAVEGIKIQHEARIASVEDAHMTMKAEQAELRGRYAIIGWLLTLIGAPIAVALILAGVAQLFDIQLGG